MSNVVALPHRNQPAQPEPNDHPALRRCSWFAARLVSAILGLTAVFTMAVLILGLVFQGAFIWLAPGAGFIGAPPEGVVGVVAFGALPWPTRLAYGANFTLTQTPVLVVLYLLRTLLRDLAVGTLFAAGHALRLRRMAFWLLAYAVAPLGGQVLVRAVGYGVDLAWFRTSALHALLLAAILIVFAELIRAGQAIKDDRDGFV
ncbi:DUF2975 domain-containing protein [Methylobacterium sp. NPDC080182]|uniref:DUF2975 domain-containing protein n=1 Tax=Methylobacterium sp. NPDC080182 TaxID=3390590 RepID=UPI003D038090